MSIYIDNLPYDLSKYEDSTSYTDLKYIWFFSFQNGPSSHLRICLKPPHPQFIGKYCGKQSHCFVFGASRSVIVLAAFLWSDENVACDKCHTSHSAPLSSAACVLQWRSKRRHRYIVLALGAAFASASLGLVIEATECVKTLLVITETC